MEITHQKEYMLSISDCHLNKSLRHDGNCSIKHGSWDARFCSYLMSISAKLFASGERKFILVHDKDLINIRWGIYDKHSIESDDNSCSEMHLYIHIATNNHV